MGKREREPGRGGELVELCFFSASFLAAVLTFLPPFLPSLPILISPYSPENEGGRQKEEEEEKEETKREEVLFKSSGVAAASAAAEAPTPMRRLLFGAKGEVRFVSPLPFMAAAAASAEKRGDGD